MIRPNGRMMSFTFYSKKNNAVMTVHSKQALECANIIEQDEDVISYETNISIERIDDYISMQGIRTEYRNQVWISDFQLTKADGSQTVVEVSTDSLSKAELQRMELSRRYWTRQGISFAIFWRDKK